MEEREKKMMSEGVREPDIVKECKAVMFFFIAFVCAMLVLAAVLGVGYGIYELVKYLIG